MKCLYLGVLLILSVLTSIGNAYATATEPRIALVLGNTTYKNAPPLKNPVNDAREMAKALQELGFSVIRVENGTKQQLEHAIGQFSAKLTEGSRADAGETLDVRIQTSSHCIMTGKIVKN